VGHHPNITTTNHCRQPAAATYWLPSSITSCLLLPASLWIQICLADIQHQTEYVYAGATLGRKKHKEEKKSKTLNPPAHKKRLHATLH
jgi:hypothetical protein